MKIEKVKIDYVRQDPKNKRLHTDENYLALRESLKQFGQQIPIVVGLDKQIVKGNGTWQAARELGWDYIFVHWTDLQGKDAELFAIADNRIAELSEWDYEQLSISMQADPNMADQLLRFGWTEQTLAPLKIAKWNPDKLEDLELPPSPPNLEPCVFLDFDGDDMAKITDGIHKWRTMHPGAEGKSDARCVSALCAWYAKQPKELS